MSDSPLTLREKLVKAGTWVFLICIFAIIVVSFGMPDFMGTSSRVDAFNAAQVGSDYLTKGEVAEYQKRMEERMGQTMKGLDDKNRKLFEDMTRGRALDEAIERKLFTQLLQKTGFTPSSSSEGKILAGLYKKNFSEYIVDGKLDRARLEEFLGQRRLTLDQLSRGWLSDYGPQLAFEMLKGTSYASDFALLDEARFASTRNSLRIVVLDSAAKDKLLRARFVPTEKDIQDKFKTEFLAKDPKAVLDASKRESIRATLFNERRATLDKDLIQNLATAGKNGIDAIAATAGLRVIAIDDAGLATDLDSKKGKEFASASLSQLSQSEQFIKERLSAPLGKVVGPVDAGGVNYFFSVVRREASALPQSTSYAKLENVSAEFSKVKNLPKEAAYDKVFESAAKNNYGQILTAAVELQRSSTRIIRYNRAAKPE